ncbi:hypothetical protein K458DRAFT_351593 [Lentithecium fluviatile CBS 122367]|uniref:Uncharacterized protein n=1 Tax=Lentithecium fluviatile CBS 122367 TaxID=1168545 RepID=A0A6G1IE79_9PLEO|nr:hypothetical protein K458DRAFT_351593 [Lentithecium fluviatile CBS 122367]
MAKGQNLQGLDTPGIDVSQEEVRDPGILESPKANDGARRDGDFGSSFPSWSFSNDNSFDFPFSELGIERPWIDLQHTDAACLDEDARISTQSINHEQHGNANTIQERASDIFDIDIDAILLSPFPSPSAELPTFTFGESPGTDLDDPGILALTFHEQTRHLLSIHDEPSENPWSTLVWPMVKDSKALYHAVAAMTYLQQSKSNYAARHRGLLHVRKSKQALETEMNGGNMHMEAALATNIALGFAEIWDYGTTSTGREQIKGARILLQQSLANHASTPSTIDTSARLKFLANTWIYMDVIARLTSDYGIPVNPEMLSLFNPHSPRSSASEMDPLMGYASTLFPTIGRVGDLVSSIRARPSKRNSPSIISLAISLRKSLESWAPPISLEHLPNPTPNMSDAIQTAEAYRWSTLLFLQQAVPELPNLGSVGELGQRTLVYLATIPTTSQTMVVHTYPLMVAGIEAVDEDRAFVRERWRCMAKRMVTGVIDRCLEITEEVWRRRDEYLAEYEARSPSRVSSPVLVPRSTDDGNAHLDLDTDGTSALNINAHRNSPPRIPPNRNPSLSTHFPISAAFKKGADPLTRSGNVEYTVKGKLHWLGVMKDWGWELMLG